MRRILTLALATLSLAASSSPAQPPQGYYREPSLAGNTVYFVAEGDLWKVPAAGGAATRLTSHPGEESTPIPSPDGSLLAFVATYEGPMEIYTMPVTGGLPTRRTYGAGNRAAVASWTPDGKILFRTDARSTLPNRQLAELTLGDADPAGNFRMLPLAQASDGWKEESGRTLFFTRFRFQGSHTKRYQGGTAQNIWRFAEGDPEAVCLTRDYPGTSRRPMAWNNRVYFVSDRDGFMNLWSMKPDGSDLKQHTRHDGWDVASPYLNDGRIVYQLGADLRILDIASGEDRLLAITLDSDFDQTREHWIKEPMDYLTAAHPSPDGDRVVLTARGQVFVAPHRQGRLVEVTRRTGVRYRDARFLPDGKTLLLLSDQSGEVEFWKYPANGVGAGTQVTDDAVVLRWEGIPSPDGNWIAHHDKFQRLYLHDLRNGTNRLLDESETEGFSAIAWSPDSRWIAYVGAKENLFHVVKLAEVETGRILEATTDRWESYAPQWSADGKWLYLLSDRNLQSLTQSVWGPYQPEPFLDRTTGVYLLPLTPGLRSPFLPEDEVSAAAEKDEADTTVTVNVVAEGLAGRLQTIPIPPGNYRNLMLTEDALFWLSASTDREKSDLMGAKIANLDFEVNTVLEDVESAELTADGKKLLVRKGKTLHLLDASPAPATLEKTAVDLSAWKLSLVPREEWRQMYTEAWRLFRDYFYDRNMHGVDWPAVREKYAPLVDRVSSREELSDILAMMSSELSTLHHFVYGGDMRSGPDDVTLGALGAELVRDPATGGYRVTRIYTHDPDEPDRASPLRRPGVDVTLGDVILSINGVALSTVDDPGSLLRNQAGQQVLMTVRPSLGGEPRDVILVPMTGAEEAELRYHEWEYTRRLETERLGEGKIGYVHLRAMGSGNFTEWAKGYYPVFTRSGLIVDVRHNRGGNIDSWILGRLLRKAWMYWSQPVGKSPTWNMQYAFRGHVVVLCNESTASDGEVFAEGIRRLGIGEAIGTRTWGGEIWLSSDNFLVDRGIATAAEYGVYGPEGEWLIEGHGVEPDIVVDNLPHETFKGRDAQLERGVQRLLEKIREEPVPAPPQPPFPDKSYKN